MKIQKSVHDQSSLENEVNKFVTILNDEPSPVSVKRILKEFVAQYEPDERPSLLDQLRIELSKYSDPKESYPCLMFNTDIGREKLRRAFEKMEEYRQDVYALDFNCSQFKITDKLSKSDLIRILNVIYELKFICNLNEEIPSKKDFMLAMGRFLSTDLSRYDEILTKGNIVELEKYLSIFNTMIDKAQSIWFSKNKTSKKTL